MKKHLLSAMFAFIAIVLQSQTIIYVKSDGSGNGTSWNKACNLEDIIGRDGQLSASTGTQIWVQKGTYYPSGMLTIPVSVKMYGGFSGSETALSQRDSSPNLTIIDAQYKFGSVVRLSVSAELNGFTIQNGVTQDNPHRNGGGVFADDHSIIANCTIIHNSALVNGGGIYAKGPMNIIHSVIENNTASGEGANVFGNCVTAQQTAPIIIYQPNSTSQNKQQGIAFSALSAVTVGEAPLSYQWYSNTANNNTGGTLISGATNASYFPPSATIGTSYYYCKVSNALGSVTSDVSGLHTVTPAFITMNLDYTGTIQNITLPAGKYKLECWGAGGGNAGSYTGGYGAFVSTVLYLDAGSYKVIVGGVGGSVNSGLTAAGGGASAVIINSSNSLLLVAGAGGGADSRYQNANGGYGQSSTTSGNSGSYFGSYNSGNNVGNGGEAGNAWSGGSGAGWLSNGRKGTSNGGTVSISLSTTAQGGKAGGSHGNANGGFGGGGCASWAPGGGGGYSGGAAGWSLGNSTTTAGGGSSYICSQGIERILLSGNASMPNPRGSGNITGNSGNGFVRISRED